MTTPAQSGSFDEYAHDYDRLLDDPLRKRFAGDNAFFIRQKCRAMLRALERHMPVDRRWRVLDAGCGQGAAFEFLRDSCDVVGVDVSIPMLRVAAEKGPVVAQEPFDLQFRTGGFDAAFAFCVYHHIAPADRARHLRELARVVRPGGFVFVFEHNPLNPVTRRVFNRAPVDRGCRMIARNLLRKVFTDAGLRDVRHGYVLFVPEFLDRIFGFLEQRLEWLPLGGQYYVSGRRHREFNLDSK
jgi:SAM-dependent methyltransferase